MTMTLRVVVPPHPLISHWITMLREIATPAPLYAKGLEELGRWLTYEAIREWLPVRTEEVNTSFGKYNGSIVESRVPILALPLNPGGIELWHGGRNILPNPNLFIGGIPESIEKNEGIIIYLDQITDGVNLLKTLELLKIHKVESQRVRVITALSAKEGLQRIGEAISDLNIYCACIDEELKENGEIKPGIGNPSLRINTKTKGLH